MPESISGGSTIADDDGTEVIEARAQQNALVKTRS